jgi:uncharacterized protein (DUF736 family)
VSKYETKPGEGTLWPYEPRDGKSKGSPDYKGAVILGDGRVVGLAMWEKETRKGKRFISISVDDREGEFQAKRLGRPQMTMGDGAEKRERGEDRGGSYRDHGGNRDRYSDRDERSDNRPDTRGDQHRRGFSDDLDDDIPF